jgi:threonine dehydratase
MAQSLSLEHIFLAARRIKDYIRRTPCQPSQRMNNLLNANIFMKMENMQHTGAYKERGALNKLMSLTDAEKSKGVYAASAGNHAQGLGYHAGRLGIPATIFMPTRTPTIKVTRTIEFGATVKLIGESYDDAFDACMEEVNRTGGTLVHPFDDYAIMAGQGTIGLEIMDQIPDLDVLVIPVGGGGMISGVARAAKQLNPKIRIVGVEPSRIPSMKRAVIDGDLSPQPAVVTIADGINVRKVGKLTYPLCKELVDDWVEVTEQEICHAILFLLEGEKTVAEGAGAAGVAALISKKVANIEGKRIAVVISGGNIDVNAIPQVIDTGLTESGRRIRFSMQIPDRPGSLSVLINHISQLQANV